MPSRVRSRMRSASNLAVCGAPHTAEFEAPSFSAGHNKVGRPPRRAAWPLAGQRKCCPTSRNLPENSSETEKPSAPSPGRSTFIPLRSTAFQRDNRLMLLFCSGQPHRPSTTAALPGWQADLNLTGRGHRHSAGECPHEQAAADALVAPRRPSCASGQGRGAGRTVRPPSDPARGVAPRFLTLPFEV